MYRYTVRCEFTKNNPETVEQWLAWLRDPHIPDVMKGGASGAEIVRMQGENPIFEIRYRFPDREAFDHYQAVHAPELKADGATRFPPAELGLVYHRTDGEVVFDMFDS